MHTLRTTSGLTLIEILIAAAIFGIAIIGMTTMVTTSSSVTAANKRRATAMALAQYQLEDVMRLGYMNAHADDGTEAYGTIQYGSHTYYDFQRVTTVSDDTPGRDSRTIRVDVFWNNGEGPVTVRGVLGR